MTRIQLNDPSRLDELRHALSNADCPSVPVRADTLLVAYPLALDGSEARVELDFFLRAWQAARPDVEVELLS